MMTKPAQTVFFSRTIMHLCKALQT